MNGSEIFRKKINDLPPVDLSRRYGHAEQIVHSSDRLEYCFVREHWGLYWRSLVLTINERVGTPQMQQRFRKEIISILGAPFMEIPSKNADYAMHTTIWDESKK